MCVDQNRQNNIRIKNSTQSHHFRNFVSKNQTSKKSKFLNFFIFDVS